MREVNCVKIVILKSPKFLSGFLRLIFKIN